MRRASLTVALVTAPAALALAALAGPAAAEVSGSCDGSASFLEGTEADGPFTVDARDVGDEVIVVPRSDTVEWTGSVAAPPGEYSGELRLDLPPLLPDLAIDSWSGDSESTSNSGVEEYDIPSVAPAGVTIRVVGEHTDDNGTCSGYVNVEIEGGAFDSPVTYASLALTGITGAALLAALKPLLGPIGRPAGRGIR